MRKLLFFSNSWTVIVCLVVCSRTLAQTVTVVVPNALESREGNQFNRGTRAIKFQQVFPASEFAALSGPHLIKQIAWRPDGTQVNAPRTVRWGDVQIRLATKSEPGRLSPTFADNIGPDVMTVRDGPLELTTENNGPEGGPKKFDYRIELEEPFFRYDPARGDLLLEFTPRTGSSASLGADGDNSVLGPTLLLVCNPDEPVAIDCSECIPAGNCLHAGAVTEFTFHPVPAAAAAPMASAWALAAVAAVFLLTGTMLLCHRRTVGNTS